MRYIAAIIIRWPQRTLKDLDYVRRQEVARHEEIAGRSLLHYLHTRYQIYPRSAVLRPYCDTYRLYLGRTLCHKSFLIKMIDLGLLSLSLSMILPATTKNHEARPLS
jgi:hypothetical protein